MIRHRTNKSGPPPQHCPLEASLKLLSGAWTPKILWYLRSETRRFGDLKRDLGTISAKVLTTRLRELEKRGVITRAVKPTSPPTVEYSLTPLGHKLGPALEAIADLGKELSKEKSPVEAGKAQSSRKESYSKVSEVGWDVAKSREVPIV
jgi:DNA-binding HxlR family transcriptional regulator